MTYYPQLSAKTTQIDPLVNQHVTTNQRPRVDVVFVLDTTGSMSDLIQTAKEKIWSIATTMASAQPTPEIRIGLVAYRDRGDEYVTKVVDLSADLDSVYATLMDFEADGGGDTPESVNQALYDAVHRMSWSQGEQAYQAIFLVGDAPPHMDYNEVQYPAIVASREGKGIVINTVQCGDMPFTVEPWTQIASLGHGDFFQVEQAGGAVAFTTPYDEEIAELSAKLDDTRLYYGTDAEKEKMQAKVSATEKLQRGCVRRIPRAARRVSTHRRPAGLTCSETTSWSTRWLAARSRSTKFEEDALPEALKPMAPAEQRVLRRAARRRAGRPATPDPGTRAGSRRLISKRKWRKPAAWRIRSITSFTTRSKNRRARPGSNTRPGRRTS